MALERVEVSLAKGLKPIAVAAPEELAHAGRSMGLHKGDRAADPPGQRLQLLGHPPGVIEPAEPDQSDDDVTEHRGDFEEVPG